VVAVGCGGRGQDEQSVDLMFTRADASIATFPDTVRAWCAPFDENNSHRDAVHVLAGELPREESPPAYWILRAVRADVERDPVTTLPDSFVYTEARGASFFALDDRGNEVSSADEESKGTIRVELEGCESGDTVRADFQDVVLGSEYSDLPPISVEGSVTADIGGAPDRS
jgi:hypothetical protein